ncbi:cytochrome c oxidase assembly factor 3 homolog, mitochondrial [Melanotaenia boesemani]|uniref:cytochrome c oxidase assembly factor 3 homolog, mitochondrial n=1 Tax=Melanotaenia boesemani TaxID=1250792 RepID=UPI001C05B16A|nr:cytochrome c oxidase assembly factor 3 homolog, mitochondrial [Melanotaenia boesemani]
MAEKGTAKAAQTAAEKQLLLRRQQLDYFKKNAERLRTRNLLTGLCIGAFVAGVFGYTILSVKQERIVEELDEEARIHVIRGPRTGANS